MIDLALDGLTLVKSMLALGLALGIFTYFIKRFFAKGMNGDLSQKYAEEQKPLPNSSRTKYPEADVFRVSGTFLNLGLVVSIAIVTLAFSWTQYEKPVFIPEFEPLEEDIEIAPPPTTTPPPPPPPPPPPQIQEVPEEEILEEEEPEFVDSYIDEYTEVFAEAVEEKAPPPPPVPVEVEPEAPELPFIRVEQMPRFPGCEDIAGGQEEKAKCSERKMLEFIYRNIKYPPIARENGIEGTCVIYFVVNEEGKVVDTSIKRDIGGSCGKEALRVINLMKSMPNKWTPGKQRGRRVKVQFNIPVRFKLH